MSRSRRQIATFSLFTFLDVMLCTLGALIIVLICVVRTAQMKNAEDTPQTAAEVEEIASQRDTVQWRAKHLEASREQTRAQLSDRRRELSHIEEHSRRLRLQWAEMEAAKKALAGSSQKKQQLEQLRAEVDRVSQLATAAERDLDDARREADSKRPSYAVIPYEGPSQTMRRPLYIECTGEHIILQPEHIELSSNDFAGPLGPGNPLAAGLRAAREYLDSYQGDNLADSGEPYPLLLVRPDGVEAYYVAREAMTSWGSEFGYELIDQDWKLEFREPAPAMVEAMRLAVDEARMRQQALARSAPRYFSEKKGAQWYRAPSGGVVQESGPSDDDVDRSRNGWGGRRGGGGGGGRRGGGYANQGNGGSGNWNGQGNKRGAGSGRYPSNYGNGSGTGTGEDSTGANSDAELTSIYGAAANTAPGSGSGSGSGNSPTGAMQGTGYGNPAGGVNPNGNGAGNNMFASGQGTGGGAGIDGTSVDNGTGDGSAGGTGGGLGLSAGGGDSLLASGNGNSRSSSATLPGAAGSGGAATNPAGTPGAGGAAGTSVAGFNGQPYGSGTSTALGTAGGQAMASPGTTAAPGAASAGTTSAPAGNLVGNGTTGGDGVISNVPGAPDGGTSGQPGGQQGGQPGAQQGPAGPGSSNQAKGRQGQQGAGGLGLQPNSQAGGAASGQPGSPGGQAGMMPAAGNGQSSPTMSPSGPPSFQFGQQGQQGQQTANNSMADSRGKNWSLPEEARHSVPITRPVRVECRADRLVLQMDQNPAQTQEIPLTERTEDSVEDLVSAVWKRVDTWGSAGRGMYWRPQLAIDVAPGGEARYADLQTLLTDSGLEVKPAAKAPVQVARPKRKVGPW